MHTDLVLNSINNYYCYACSVKTTPSHTKEHKKKNGFETDINLGYTTKMEIIL